MKSKLKYLFLSLALLAGCTSDVKEVENPITNEDSSSNVEMPSQEITNEENKEVSTETKQPQTNSNASENKAQTSTDLGKPDTSKHKLIKVDGGDTSGYRQSNVVVDIGFGDREYWAYTNEHGQLVRVTAKKIVLQNEPESQLKDGRYYSKMADVPGVGAATGYDRGHVIADSLGGVANAYNITPQEATLNRHGDQAYMEDVIRKAGGATDFEAIITYPNTKTQIPSNYKFTYTVKGNKVVDEFANGNPDKANKDAGLTSSSNNNTSNQNSSSTPNVQVSTPPAQGDLASVDTNGNGKVTIKEAKDAGYKMPITKDHWLYQYMDDRDGDGFVGE